jgi:hypothetical protein
VITIDRNAQPHCKPLTATNSSRIRPRPFRLLDASRPANATTNSSRVVMLIAPCSPPGPRTAAEPTRLNREADGLSRPTAPLTEACRFRTPVCYLKMAKMNHAAFARNQQNSWRPEPLVVS